MRTISTFTLGLILLATGPAFAREQTKKSATSTTTTSSSPVAQNAAGKTDSKDTEYIIVVYDSGAETGEDSYKRLILGSNAVQAKSVTDLNVKLLKLDIATCNKGPGSRLFQLMEDKPKTSKRTAVAGWVDAHRPLFKVGATAVVYENATAGWWSPSVVLVVDPDNPSITENQVCNLVKDSRDTIAKVTGQLPATSKQALARPGDVLVLWHAGDKKQAVLDCEAAAKLAQLKFEEYNVNTAEGKAKFDRRMAKFAPATRLKFEMDPRNWAKKISK